MLPPHRHSPKLYSEVVAGREGKKFKLTIKTKGNHTQEEIRRVPKRKVNSAEIKVGITSLKTLRDGRVIIEAGSKQEIDSLGDKIG